MEAWKKNVVNTYLDESFKACVLFCTDDGIITPEKEREVITAYDTNEDFEHEVIVNFFDSIGISEDEFLEISEEFESN